MIYILFKYISEKKSTSLGTVSPYYLEKCILEHLIIIKL